MSFVFKNGKSIPLEGPQVPGSLDNVETQPVEIRKENPLPSPPKVPVIDPRTTDELRKKYQKVPEIESGTLELGSHAPTYQTTAAVPPEVLPSAAEPPQPPATAPEKPQPSANDEVAPCPACSS